MKKLCLLLLLFSYISVVPSFAAKIIVNDDTDRRVISRSSGPEAFVQYYEVTDDDVDEKTISAKKAKGYQLEKYKTQNLPLLKGDFRIELIGTTWDYSVEEEPEQEPVVEEVVAEEVVVPNRKLHREPTDYYTRDTLKNPDVLIPCADLYELK